MKTLQYAERLRAQEVFDGFSDMELAMLGPEFLALYAEARSSEWSQEQLRVLEEANIRAENRSAKVLEALGVNDFVPGTRPERFHLASVSRGDMGVTVDIDHHMVYCDSEDVVIEGSRPKVHEGSPTITVYYSENNPGEGLVMITTEGSYMSGSYDSRISLVVVWEPDDSFSIRKVSIGFYPPRVGGSHIESVCSVGFSADGKLDTGASKLYDSQGTATTASIQGSTLYNVLLREGFQSEKALDIQATIEATLERYVDRRGGFPDLVWKNEPESAGNPDPTADL